MYQLTGNNSFRRVCRAGLCGSDEVPRPPGCPVSFVSAQYLEVALRINGHPFWIIGCTILYGLCDKTSSPPHSGPKMA